MKRLIFLLLLLGLLASPSDARRRWTPKIQASSSGTAFVTGQTIGTPRTNGAGAVTGFRVTVGAAPITITHVGRYKALANSQTHFVGFFTDGSSPIAGGSALVNMSLSADPDGYVYTALAVPLVLSAGTSYRLMAEEFTAGDIFYDADTTITTTAVGTVSDGCYDTGGPMGGGATGQIGGANHSYGPVTFKYTL